MSFLSQKTYPGEFLRPEIIWSKSYWQKCSIWSNPPPPTLSLICHFLKILKNLNCLELETNIFRIFISLWYLPLVKNVKKIHHVLVTCPGWFNMELPYEEFFPLSNHCHDHCQMSLTHFHSGSCQGNILLHQNYATY